MLSVQDIVLQGVTLGLRAGEVVALLGRNGVGKTTLARSILGLTSAKRGTILFKDIDITHMPAHRIARMGIGIVPQGRHIFRSLTPDEAERWLASTRFVMQMIEEFRNYVNKSKTSAAA